MIHISQISSDYQDIQNDVGGFVSHLTKKK